MDLSCIISSGDLELYVLGLLPEEEAYKITQLAELFPEVREEIDRISESLLQLSTASVPAPAPAVKSELMKKIQSLKGEERAAAPVISLQTEEQVNEQGSQAPVVPLHPQKKGFPALAAAGFIGFILAVGGVIYLMSKNNQKEDQIASLQQRVQTLNRRVVEQQRQNTAYAEMLHMLQSDTYRKIKLTAVPGKPDAWAQVFWNTQTKEVFINNVSLPQAPPNKQYQLWAIVDGKPVDAGLLQDTRNRVQKMKAFQKAEAFAITLERKGGSPSPTLQEMYVMGQAS